MNTKKKTRFEYAGGYIYGRGYVDKEEKSLAALRLINCLKAVPHKRGKVLEVGCGGGKLIRSLKRYRPELEAYACDIDFRAIRENRFVCDGVKYFISDAARLPYPDRSFDVVLMFDVLEHLPEIPTVLKEVWRVLKDDGFFHFYVPCEKNWFTVYRWVGRVLKKRHGGHIQCLTNKEVISLCSEHNLLIKHIYYSDYLFTQICDLMFFLTLELSRNKALLWKAHSGINNEKQNSFMFYFLEFIRKLLSFISFYESKIFKGRFGAMGLHLTCQKASL